MAWGFRCLECGFQETDHEFDGPDREGTPCKRYKSPDLKEERRLWREEKDEEARAGGVNGGSPGLVLFSKGRIYDIGS